MGRPSRRSIFDVNSTQEPDPKVAGFRLPAQFAAAPHVAAARPRITLALHDTNV
jgi:hypothetical protein